MNVLFILLLAYVILIPHLPLTLVSIIKLFLNFINCFVTPTPTTNELVIGYYQSYIIFYNQFIHCPPVFPATSLKYNKFKGVILFQLERKSLKLLYFRQAARNTGSGILSLKSSESIHLNIIQIDLEVDLLNVYPDKMEFHSNNNKVSLYFYIIIILFLVSRYCFYYSRFILAICLPIIDLN